MDALAPSSYRRGAHAHHGRCVPPLNSGHHRPHHASSGCDHARSKRRFAEHRRSCVLLSMVAFASGSVVMRDLPASFTP